MKLTDWLTKSSSPSSNSSFGSQDNSENDNNRSSSKMPPKDKKTSTPNSSKASTPKSSTSTPKGGAKPSPPKSSKASTSKNSTPVTSEPKEKSKSAASGTTTTVQGAHSTDVVLPQTRVKIIMKSSPEIESVGHDVLFLITKATELFIDHITTETYVQSHKPKQIEYRHLADVAHKHQNLEFLKDIIPMKMLARDALKEMAKQSAAANKELLGD